MVQVCHRRPGRWDRRSQCEATEGCIVRKALLLCLFNWFFQFCFYLFVYSLVFSHTIRLNRSFPFLHFSQSLPHLPSPPDPVILISLQKIADLLGTSTEHGITRCNKTSHKPSYQGWTRQPSRRRVWRCCFKKKFEHPKNVLNLTLL